MGSSEIGVGSILLLSFIIFLAIGYKKGAVKKIFSVLSLFLSLILAKLLYPFAIRAVVENETLKGIFTSIWSFLLPAKDKMLSVPNSLSEFLPSQPEPAKPLLFGGMYEVVGKWQDQVAQYIITFINGILFFLLLYLLFRLLMKILQQVMEYLFKLPGLNFGNRMLGLCLGAIEWIFFIWVLLILFSFIPESKFSLWLLEGFSVEGSIPYFIKENNWIAQLFLG